MRPTNEVLDATLEDSIFLDRLRIDCSAIQGMCETVRRQSMNGVLSSIEKEFQNPSDSDDPLQMELGLSFSLEENQ